VIAKPLIINLFECFANFLLFQFARSHSRQFLFFSPALKSSAWLVARKHYATRVVHLEVLMCLRRIERQKFSTVALQGKTNGR
jgi:hypothetical protein